MYGKYTLFYESPKTWGYLRACANSVCQASPQGEGPVDEAIHTGVKVTINRTGGFWHSTVVSRKYAPPFATLASVQNAGGAYARDATISLAITPSLPIPVKHDLTVGIAEREAERCSPTLPVG